MNAIEVFQIEKQYASLKALDGISLSVPQGEFFGLLGPNGAGKTTLISIMAGLTRATRGSIEILGKNVVSQYKQARRLLGVVPQEVVFDPFFTVRETLVLQSGYFGIKNNDDWIDEILHELSLTDKVDTNMRALSGGMKRRVLIAQALVHKPPVIVLDEPTAGVDVELRQTLWKFIARLNKKNGHTIVLTTHYLNEAEDFCDRVAILKNGRIVALDTIAGLTHKLSGLRLIVSFEKGILPQDLRPRILHEDLSLERRYVLRINDSQEAEEILSSMRIAGIEITDIQIQRADLEDVFLKIMDEETK